MRVLLGLAAIAAVLVIGWCLVGKLPGGHMAPQKPSEPRPARSLGIGHQDAPAS
jgi:hypothetical protein